MALAASLIPGFQYRVIDGQHAGEIVTIVDNEVIHRKVKVTMNGEEGTILPRQLADNPVGMVSQNGETTTMAEVIDGMPSELEALARSTIDNPLTDPMDPRLKSFRNQHPDELLAEYVPRTMSNGMTDVEFLLTYTSGMYRSENQGYPANVALKGDTQSGKTMLVEVLACEWSKVLGHPEPMPVFTISGSAGITDFVLFGQPAPYVDAQGNNRIVHLPGIVELAAMVGGIIYIDEINAIAERYTTSLFPVLDRRHEFTNYNKPVDKGGLPLPEHVKLPLDTWCIATYNEGYEGMVKLNRAVHQRFDHILWDYDPKVEKALIASEHVRAIGTHFRIARKERKITQPIGTAVLQRFQRNMDAFGVDMAVEIFLGMFDARERTSAKEILDARGTITNLHEEVRKAAEAAARNVRRPRTGDTSADMLADVIADSDPF